MRQLAKTSPLFFAPLRTLPGHAIPDIMDKFGLLFKKLQRFLSSRGRSADDIDDLMQEAFLRLQVYGREHAMLRHRNVAK
jgi:hypothetical protein